jgi:16S rRNA (uracil1498-N3)-methyltransferase
VAQGIAKGDRGELAVQAMTEVGTDAIIPWAAARSVARWTSPRPYERWVATAREAAKQARRAWVPSVEPAASTRELAGRVTLVLHEEATVPLSAVELPGGADIVLVVGPEGGITPEELDAFQAAGAQAVRLGPHVLRTSTAGPAAVAVLSTRLGRW